MSTKNLDSIQKELIDLAQEVKFISINAHIEASKSLGEDGRRFTVVSQEMAKASKKLDNTLKDLVEYSKEI